MLPCRVQQSRGSATEFFRSILPVLFTLCHAKLLLSSVSGKLDIVSVVSCALDTHTSFCRSEVVVSSSERRLARSTCYDRAWFEIQTWSTLCKESSLEKCAYSVEWYFAVNFNHELELNYEEQVEQMTIQLAKTWAKLGTNVCVSLQGPLKRFLTAPQTTPSEPAFARVGGEQGSNTHTHAHTHTLTHN